MNYIFTLYHNIASSLVDGDCHLSEPEYLRLSRKNWFLSNLKTSSRTLCFIPSLGQIVMPGNLSKLHAIFFKTIVWSFHNSFNLLQIRASFFWNLSCWFGKIKSNLLLTLQEKGNKHKQYKQIFCGLYQNFYKTFWIIFFPKFFHCVWVPLLKENEGNRNLF